MATESYRYGGSSVAGQEAGDLILEGSVVNPKHVVPVGEVVELDDDRVKELRANGVKLTKTDADPTVDESGDAQTREAQQKQQAVGAGQHGTAESESTIPSARAGGKSK